MTILLVVLSCLLFLAGIFSLYARPFLSPALSYMGLLALSFAREGDFQLIPINGVILMGWLCMTVIVMLATLMQPVAVRRQSRGMGYIIGGAIVGLAIGLLGFTFSTSLSLLYGMMIVGVAAGIFFGFLLYSRTPDGAPVGISSGFFFKYLLAKGFPAAITVMQIGVVLVIIVALHNVRVL